MVGLVSVLVVLVRVGCAGESAGCPGESAGVPMVV